MANSHYKSSRLSHERIFKAMDANKDGFVTLEEMQDFIRGTSKASTAQ